MPRTASSSERLQGSTSYSNQLALRTGCTQVMVPCTSFVDGLDGLLLSINCPSSSARH